MSQLGKDERELVESFEAGDWKPLPDSETEVARYQEYAAAAFRKDRRPREAPG